MGFFPSGLGVWVAALYFVALGKQNLLKIWCEPIFHKAFRNFGTLFVFCSHQMIPQKVLGGGEHSLAVLDGAGL